jgi:two-component system, NarL family, sensor kinase
MALASEYAIYGLITNPGAAPGAAALAWFSTWAIAIPLGLLAALLLLFPTGRPPSPRWRWWLWVAGLGNVLFILSHLSFWPLRGAGLLRLDTSDPAGLPGVLFTVGATVGPVAVLAAGVSVLVRFRRARGAERQQIKWLLYAVLTVILGYPLLIVAMIALGVYAGAVLLLGELFGGDRWRAAELGSGRRHPGRGRAVPAGPPPYPTSGGPAL